MSVLCHGSTHVYRAGSLRCTCGAAANGYPPTVGVAMYGLPPSYNPFSPHTPATPSAPDVPLAVLKAARDAGATHLSADGLRAYDQRKYTVWFCFWDDKAKKFGSWYRIVSDELPADAVKL